MNKIALVTDTTVNMPPDMVARMDIRVVPVYVNFGTESYKDYEELPPAKFYEKLAAVKAAGGEMPKTSQPSPEDFRKVYEQCREEGSHSAISVHVTAKASGTCASAELAKTMAGHIHVHVVDSATTSMQMGFMLMEAHDAMESGGGLPEMLAAVEKVKAHSSLVFTVTELEHLAASGRTEGAEKATEAAVKVKPVISIEGGVPKAVGQERTQKAALERVLAMTKEKMANHHLQRLAVVHGNTEAKAKEWAKEATAALGFSGEPYVVDFGPALAVHFGPGLLGVAAQWG
ncbi:MAG: DegV family protein [Chloroflexi bacterium]|nr:DegV family protein [Chloroflexota bacterium]